MASHTYRDANGGAASGADGPGPAQGHQIRQRQALSRCALELPGNGLYDRPATFKAKILRPLQLKSAHGGMSPLQLPGNTFCGWPATYKPKILSPLQLQSANGAISPLQLCSSSSCGWPAAFKPEVPGPIQLAAAMGSSRFE